MINFRPGLKLILGGTSNVFNLTAEAANCNEECTDHTDCIQATCKECVAVGGGVNRCLSCCLNEDELDCISPCYWNATYVQCQNIEGVDCSGIPELPSQSRGVALWGGVAFALALTVFLVYRKKQLSKRG